MDAPTSTLEPTTVVTTDGTTIPASLCCEMCGEAAVCVVVVWMTTKDADRLCSGCYLISAITVAGVMTDENPG